MVESHSFLSLFGGIVFQPAPQTDLLRLGCWRGSGGSLLTWTFLFLSPLHSIQILSTSRNQKERKKILPSSSCKGATWLVWRSGVGMDFSPCTGRIARRPCLGNSITRRRRRRSLRVVNTLYVPSGFYSAHSSTLSLLLLLYLLLFSFYTLNREEEEKVGGFKDAPSSFTVTIRSGWMILRSSHPSDYVFSLQFFLPPKWENGNWLNDEMRLLRSCCVCHCRRPKNRSQPESVSGSETAVAAVVRTEGGVVEQQVGSSRRSGGGSKRRQRATYRYEVVYRREEFSHDYLDHPPTTDHRHPFRQPEGRRVDDSPPPPNVVAFQSADYSLLSNYGRLEDFHPTALRSTVLGWQQQQPIQQHYTDQPLYQNFSGSLSLFLLSPLENIPISFFIFI